MTRLKFNPISPSAIIYIVVFLMIFSACATKEEMKAPYNVLFLIVDDMNDYGFHDTYPDVKMPYIDKFQEEAVTFRYAYCTSPACTPSRASTFSGLYPHNTGGYFNGSDPWRKSEVLINQVETLPELYKKNGYKTFGRGKLFHAQLSEGRRELNWDNEHFGGGFGPFPDSLHQVKGRFWGYQAFPDSIFPDVINMNATIDFLSQKHDEPFFAAFGVWRPHTPFTAPQRFFDKYNIDDIQLPPGYLKNDLDDVDSLALRQVDPWGRFIVSGAETEAEWKKMIWAYLACTTFADWTIGSVIEALDNSQYADNTIVVFWSDNGYHCGEKDHWEKGTLWEQADLVPLAIRIPGNPENSKSTTKPVSLVDLYPTLVDYCSLEQPKQSLDGLSLRPLLENTASNWNRPALTTLGIEYTSLRNERYRYIKFIDGAQELYDHQTDPHEFNNLIGDPAYQAVIDEFQKHIPDTWEKELKGRRF